MELAKLLLEFISQGGTAAVIVILATAIAVLIWDRRSLVRTLAETTQRVYDAKDKQATSIQEILERYHQGNIDLINALNEIKHVLMTIQMSKK